MEQAVQQIFDNHPILQQATDFFSAKTTDLKLLGDFENFVYEAQGQDSPFILRITHSTHRSENLVKAELEWVYFLADKGVNVARPILSKNGQLVETIEVEGSYFMVTGFEKAAGNLITTDHFNDTELIKAWGQTIGKMHAATQDFTPSAPHLCRNHWYDEPYAHIDKIIPAHETLVLKNAADIIQKVRELPTPANAYGLIHADMHHGNFFTTADYHLTVFDFDDCTYKWLIADIAIAIYYSAKKTPKESRQEYARFFMRHFMEGYQRAYALHANWLETLPLFFKLRDVTLYTALSYKWDSANLTPIQQNILQQFKYRIEQKIAVLSL